MRILVSKKKCAYLGIVLLLMIITTILLEFLNQNNAEYLKISILIQCFSFLGLFILLGYVNKSFITLYSVFLVVFYVFQNGQLILYALDVDVNFYYVEKFSVELLHKSVIFSNLCMFSAFAAGIFSFDERKGWITKRLDNVLPKFLYDVALIGVGTTGIVAYGLIGVKFFVWLRGGYSLIIVFESAIPSILGAVEALFPAFCILAIVAGVKSQLKVKPYLLLILFLIWGLLTALIGDRTTGIGVVVASLLMFYFGYFSASQKVHKIIFCIGGIVVLFLIISTAQIRNHDQVSLESDLGIFTSVLYELGFSFFPLTAIMNMCPSAHEYLMGESIFSSVITGFFPESLDFFGLLSNMADKAATPTYWIADRYQYGFGMDCSLNAEMYANFGMLGFLGMFAICACVALALKKVDYKSDQNVFSQYMGLALLFGWFTLPRRRCYYIYNKIFWYVIIIGIFIAIMYMIREKRGIYAGRK